MTARPHMMSSAHQIVTLLATVAWARVWAERIQELKEAQLSHRGRAMPRVVEYFG